MEDTTAGGVGSIWLSNFSGAPLILKEHDHTRGRARMMYVDGVGEFWVTEEMLKQSFTLDCDCCL